MAADAGLWRGPASALTLACPVAAPCSMGCGSPALSCFWAAQGSTSGFCPCSPTIAGSASPLEEEGACEAKANSKAVQLCCRQRGTACRAPAVAACTAPISSESRCCRTGSPWAPTSWPIWGENNCLLLALPHLTLWQTLWWGLESDWLAGSKSLARTASRSTEIALSLLLVPVEQPASDHVRRHPHSPLRRPALLAPCRGGQLQ